LISNVSDYCLQNGTHKLPAERLVLVFKPGECVLKMLRMKIWPIFIPDIEICIKPIVQGENRSIGVFLPNVQSNPDVKLHLNAGNRF